MLNSVYNLTQQHKSHSLDERVLKIKENSQYFQKKIVEENNYVPLILYTP